MPLSLMKTFLLSIFISCVFYSSLIQARQKQADPESIPDILDIDRRQASSRRFEITPYGGDYFGDKLQHSFIVGGNVQFNITPMLGIAGDFGYSKASVDGTSALGASFTNKNVFLGDAAFVVTIPAAYRSKRGTTEADFFTSIGGGVVSFNGEARGAAFLGGGMKIRPNIPWLAIRVEIRNYFTSINNPGGSDFEDDLSIRIGPTFLLPPDF